MPRDSAARQIRITPLARETLKDGGWHSTVEVQLAILRHIAPERIVQAGHRHTIPSPQYKALPVEEQIKRGLRQMALDSLKWLVYKKVVQRTKTQDGHDRWRLAPVQVSQEEQTLNTAVTHAVAAMHKPTP
jgi:hypothetical protein